MEAAARAGLRPLHALTGIHPGAVAAWTLPFVAILYLGLNHGGYGPIERSEVGILASWALLIGAVVGALSLTRTTRAARWSLGLLAAFAAWTVLSLIWTTSAERTVTEVGRVLAYAGIFVLMVAVQGRDRAHSMVNGVACGLAVICGVAVLSRLEPTWFSVPDTRDVFPSISARLSYPLEYTSGLGGLTAVAIPVLLGVAYSARTLVGRALTATAIPVCALALWLTASGLSVPVLVAALAVYVALAPDRLPKLATLAAAAGGAAITFAALVQREALDLGFEGALAQSQGDEVLRILIVVAAGVGLTHAGISVAADYLPRPRWMTISERGASRIGAVLIGLLVVAATIFLASGAASRAWDHFKSEGSDPTESRAAQIVDLSSTGRYDFWQAAMDQSAEDPLVGGGAGTYELWWAREGSGTGFVRDAHSLYAESLGELGVIGFLLIVALSVAVIATGAVRALRTPAALRNVLAAATAGCVAFCLAAAIDWMWELAVLPVVFLALAAVAVQGGAEPPEAARRTSSAWGVRGSIAAIGLVALVVNALVLSGAQELQRSETEAARGNLGEALEAAQAASASQPYASTPHLQEALVLERMGRVDPAIAEARQATDKDPDDWRPWLVLSRLEARSGDVDATLAAYSTAKSLNPHSRLFAQ
jgi:hypothetical protein